MHEMTEHGNTGGFAERIGGVERLFAEEMAKAFDELDALDLPTEEPRAGRTLSLPEELYSSGLWEQNGVKPSFPFAALTPRNTAGATSPW